MFTIYSSQLIDKISYDGKLIPHRKIGVTSQSLRRGFSKYASYEIERLYPKFWVEFDLDEDDNEDVIVSIDLDMKVAFSKFAVKPANSRSTELYDCDDETVRSEFQALAARYNGTVHCIDDVRNKTEILGNVPMA